MKNIIKSKKLLQALGVAIAAVFYLNSCDTSLEETPLDFLSSDNAYTTIAGIEQGIAGLHDKVRDDWFSTAGLGQSEFTIFRGLGTDVAFHGEDPASTSFPCNYETYLTADNSDAENYWIGMYQLIQYANVLIEGINTADESIWEDENDKNAYLGEAMFFRAYAYRFLASFFGDVPLVTEAITSPKTDFVRADTSEVYDQIEKDLEFGATYLPDRGEEEDYGRITQGAALHLLCEIYLTRKKYQDAVDVATDLIENHGYALMTERFGSTIDVFGTGDVFLDLFANGNQNLAENTENIWSVQFEYGITGDQSFPGERTWGPAYFRMGNTPDGYKAILGELIDGSYTGYSDTLGRPVSWIRPTNYWVYQIWQSDWDNDIRNAKHNIKREIYFDNPESAYDGMVIDFSLYDESAGRDPIKDTCQYIYPYLMKFTDPCNHQDNAATSGGGWVYKDIYAMRLAETYLFRAEAYLKLNEYQLAADDINAIRERAEATPISASDVDEEAILDERARELYGEECRHYVLRRFGCFVERVQEYNNNPKYPGLNVQDYNDLFPIPQSQIDLNVDAELTQNPGY